MGYKYYGYIIVLLVGLILSILVGCDREDIIKSKNEKPKYDSSKFYIRDWDYFNGKIFDLGRESDFSAGDTIIAIELYSSYNYYMAKPDTGIMYVAPDSTDQHLSENVDTVEVYKIENSDFTVHPTEYWIMFDEYAANYRYRNIGAYMIIKHGDGSTDTVGSIDSNPMKLKLISRYDSDSAMVTWDYMWRNIYYLRSSLIGADEIEIRIYTGEKDTEITGDNLDTQNGTPYVQILGLDYCNQNGDSIPDGYADVISPAVDMENRLLFFPDRHPFDPDTNFTDEILAPTVPEIYNNRYGSADVQTSSRYYIEVVTKTYITD